MLVERGGWAMTLRSKPQRDSHVVRYLRGIGVDAARVLRGEYDRTGFMQVAVDRSGKPLTTAREVLAKWVAWPNTFDWDAFQGAIRDDATKEQDRRLNTMKDETA